MATSLLEGVRVVDLAGEPAAAAGRVLADLGADLTDDDREKLAEDGVFK